MFIYSLYRARGGMSSDNEKREERLMILGFR
jgi:hypothetical protein